MSLLHKGRALCAVQEHLAVSMPCLHRAFCSLGLQVRRAQLAGRCTCGGAVSKTASVGVEIREACAAVKDRQRGFQDLSSRSTYRGHRRRPLSPVPTRLLSSPSAAARVPNAHRALAKQAPHRFTGVMFRTPKNITLPELRLRTIISPGSWSVM